MHRLEDESKAPMHVRQREISPEQEQRVIALRKKFIRYGKKKLVIKYKKKYGETISSWQIQKVIEKHKLYFKPSKTARIRAKRKRAQKKKRVTELQKLPKYKQTANYIICLDTVVIYWNGLKRYIFTAVDKYGKVAFARMYKSKSTINSRDFLYRLYYLFDGQVPRVGHDNGTEFEKLFKTACIELGIEQYWSRVRTPKDNAVNERFNRTLKEEFIQLGNFNSEPQIFNKYLTEWLIEYNFYRPHESLGYKTPVDSTPLLPMCSSDTLA
jgi:transposase InsO family protein